MIFRLNVITETKTSLLLKAGPQIRCQHIYLLLLGHELNNFSYFPQILHIELDSVDEETVFYQLQNVFGHLLESKLQYYVPEKFWRTFRLFGQPVNVREQQDAFEFFTQIVDQVNVVR